MAKAEKVKPDMPDLADEDWNGFNEFWTGSIRARGPAPDEKAPTRRRTPKEKT